MLKLQKFVKRGFMFGDPRKAKGSDSPVVIVTREVDLMKPVLATDLPIEITDLQVGTPTQPAERESTGVIVEVREIEGASPVDDGRTGAGEMLIPCPEPGCGRKFPTPHGVITHMRVHNPDRKPSRRKPKGKKKGKK